MTQSEQRINWDAIMESGSMTAIHNIRQYIKELERDRADLISIRNARAKCNCDDKDTVTKAKKILGDIVYMAESGLHTKNELAFARYISEAKQFLASLE